MTLDLQRPFDGQALLVAVFVVLLACTLAARMAQGVSPLAARVSRARVLRATLLSCAFMSSVLVAAFGFIPLYQQSLAQLPAAAQALWTLGTLASILFCAVRVVSAGSKAVTWASTP